MIGQSISLATKGVLCTGSSVTIVTRYVLPLNLNNNLNINKLNLKIEDPIKLNLKLCGD